MKWWFNKIVIHINQYKSEFKLIKQTIIHNIYLVYNSIWFSDNIYIYRDTRKEISLLFNQFHTLSLFFILCLLLFKHSYFILYILVFH